MKTACVSRACLTEKVTRSAGRNLWERRCSDGVLKSELRLTGISFLLQPASPSPRVALLGCGRPLSRHTWARLGNIIRYRCPHLASSCTLYLCSMLFGPCAPICCLSREASGSLTTAVVKGGERHVTDSSPVDVAVWSPLPLHTTAFSTFDRSTVTAHLLTMWTAARLGVR